jgi:hypothetical protein
VRYRFAKDAGAWVATIDRGAAGVGERKKIEGDFLTPRAASALVAARHEAGAAEIGFRAIDVQSGLSVAEIVMTRGAVDGARTRYATRNSLVPVVGSELLDAAADWLPLDPRDPRLVRTAESALGALTSGRPRLRRTFFMPMRPQCRSHPRQHENQIRRF